MIDEIKVLDAIQDLAAEKMPHLACIYTEGYNPTKAKRPCIMIEAVTTDIRSANASLLNVEMYFTVTVFIKMDSYDHANTRGLLKLRQQVMDLFRCGYLLVEGRALSIKASTGGVNWDQAYIDLKLEFMDARDETKDTTPKMEALGLNLNQRG